VIGRDEVVAGLPSMDVAGRIDRLRAALGPAGCDALVVTHLTNLRYLCGFTGSAGILVVDQGAARLVTDGRYGEQAADQIAAAEVAVDLEVAGDDQRRVVAAAVAGAERVGLEAHHVSWAASRRYAEEWFTSAEVVATTGMVESLRSVKDAGEVARIRAAASIADAALDRVRSRLGERPSEVEFASELDAAMRSLGASAPSFETIVASGPNGSRPHHRPASRRVESGDLVVIDFGARVDGYCSDMTRTVMVGEPDETQSRMLDTVTEAQAAGVAAVRSGVDAASVDAECRRVIAEAGWAEAFTHGTGHGVGLDIHEAPRVARTSGDTLAAGHIVTVEPGVYLPLHGGVRVEDTVVVTDDGCEPLTLTPKATSVA
jgi:Xaa-Pro aminopeptidase